MNNIISKHAKTVSDFNTALSDYSRIGDQAMLKSLCIPELNPTEDRMNGTARLT
jgi:hypothetical protein